MVLLAAAAVLAFAAGCKQDKGKDGESNPAGATDPSLSQLSGMIEKTPDNPELYFQRAGVYYELEGYDEAIKDVEKALSYDSVNVNYLHLLADIYMDYFQSFKALMVMQKAAALYPARIPTLLKLSEFQLILKQPERALETLAEIKAIDPQNAEMFYMAGLVFEDQGKTDEAIENFQSAVEVEPELIEAWIELGKLWASKKQPIALQFFDNALRVDSTNITALHEKAYYLSNTLNDLDGALALYKKIIISHPQYADAYYNAGLLYLDMDSIDRAYQEFNLNIEIEPTFYQAYYYRGVCEEMKGNKANAKKDYQQALDLAPDYDKAKEALARLKP